ncbi:MAG: type II 3-dehydroquinate dehydratase [Gemmatimonadetes bacterium]|nr:type II 3-dehydroquinate dehydratase [Gemmatimonadota bacterium]
MTSKILLINGPNLNNLGRRDPGHYGTKTLAEIEAAVVGRARELGVEVEAFQSNHEGAIVDFIQQKRPEAAGVIINPGALTGVGYSVLDALLDAGLPVVEVHLSNIHAREEFRRRSVFAGAARGQVSGLGWRGYLYALDYLGAETAGEASG